PISVYLPRDILCDSPPLGIVLKMGIYASFKLTWQAHATVADHPNMRALANSRVKYKFCCVVQVVTSFPYIVKEYRSSSSTYRIGLTLEDPTIRIHTYLYIGDAEYFFGNYL
ncbi:hypothetical protein HAX54_033200, partial [Datura stramonium]|nr:hypothetical protein [Datura stramonium]